MKVNKHRRKIVKVTAVESLLMFTHAIMMVTGKRLETSKNIVNSLFKNGQSVGTLLLNESSITPKEWEKIVKLVSVEWKYV